MVWEGVCSGAEGARTDRIGRILTAENLSGNENLTYEATYFSASEIDYLS
jgi:hypothetical protein